MSHRLSNISTALHMWWPTVAQHFFHWMFHFTSTTALNTPTLKPFPRRYFVRPRGLVRPPCWLSDHLCCSSPDTKPRKLFWKGDKTRKIVHIHPLESVASGWTWNRRVKLGHPHQADCSPDPKQCRSMPQAQLTDEREDGETESVCGRAV